MVLTDDGKVAIIDFDRFDYGDPWEEFNRIVWCAQKSHLFARGMVDGYFDETPPAEFWKLLALYISSNTLGSIAWAEAGVSDRETMLTQARDVLDWYGGMTRTIPTWYGEMP